MLRQYNQKIIKKVILQAGSVIILIWQKMNLGAPFSLRCLPHLWQARIRGGVETNGEHKNYTTAKQMASLADRAAKEALKYF